MSTPKSSSVAQTAPPHIAPPAMARSDTRNSETPLEMPTASALVRTMSRTLRLRCPHCGQGRVLRWWGAVIPRCASCNFRFERSDESYFSGAMFFGLMLGEFIFGLTLLAVIVSMWPAVPWDTMSWAIPAGMVVVMILMIPFSKLVWLAVDVLVRPVHPREVA
jgi:uncharacterized protein (DUF983 family)